jgi:hypothetical protein
MCGEPGAACGAGIPTFQHVYWNGKTQVKSPPPGSNGTGLQNRDAWTLETALDVEWAHAMAPLANILNVTTNPAETQGAAQACQDEAAAETQPARAAAASLRCCGLIWARSGTLSRTTGLPGRRCSCLRPWRTWPPCWRSAVGTMRPEPP